jgi:hypothetical protein
MSVLSELKRLGHLHACIYHHLVDGLELSESREEREADRFAREMLRKY